ncbi:sigma-70 family RNA polymerase sigma factor [Aeromicrobium phragmitis]|uniref:Sigma-70 family RNA polymerase sigma factor n=1 Tax=Aeromicrobium phragmitis TaxID=2478914 RepID=A0A3L8PN52_9ACTN|nr:sigma-70 family RNA polymerase sigma factor [Aeromicrobium phragmitis]RLV56751.1 sigma-70 family RNA polymerase sigma factor [Aeromicrobium phragmitis]
MVAVETERRRLVLVAYRICGSWADAEDVVQQASIEWLALPQPADNPAGWLTKTTVRRAIDALRARQRAATYVGPWLPEPIVTPSGAAPDEAIEHRETLAMAFMVLAETLTPPQRAVVVLRSLDYTHAEIAEILDISPSAARQHQVRGTRRLAAAGYRNGEPGLAARTSERAVEDIAVSTAPLLEAFLAAARDGDLERLSSLLSADVRAYQDGGGKVRAARRLLIGVRNVARFTAGVAALNRSRRAVAFVNVNGAPGAVVTLDGVRHVLSIEVRDGRIYRVFDVCNPAKHSTLGRRDPVAEADAA